MSCPNKLFEGRNRKQNSKNRNRIVWCFKSNSSLKKSLCEGTTKKNIQCLIKWLCLEKNEPKTKTPQKFKKEVSKPMELTNFPFKL